MTTYTAVCERAGDWWEITVPELPSGRVTQGRKLADVEDTVKDLVAFMTDADPGDIEVNLNSPGRNPEEPAGHAYDDPLPDMTEEEAQMARGFLRLLRNQERQTGT